MRSWQISDRSMAKHLLKSLESTAVMPIQRKSLNSLAAASFGMAANRVLAHSMGRPLEIRRISALNIWQITNLAGMDNCFSASQVISSSPGPDSTAAVAIAAKRIYKLIQKMALNPKIPISMPNGPGL